ncbi:MAG: DUF4835 family protein [Arenibacter latericius]|nr:DUF4835 family protein [Arenibacter latericius]
MRNLILVSLCFIISLGLAAQELNCTVTINADQVGKTNQQIFKTLERSLSDFVNKTNWSNREYKDNEKVNAQMFITITEYESNSFKGNIQLQSSRPVFNTSYESPILNYKDNQFNFQYIEFQPLIYSENNIDSNLVAVVSYYVYLILGLDADTFSLEGGSEYFRKAQQIVGLAQSGNAAGWSRTSGERSRFELVDNLMSNSYREYRVAMYNYHRKGLDILADNNSTGKQVVAGTLQLFETMASRHPNAFLTQLFFDAKAQEIQDIFSDGPKVDVVQLKETLNKIAPLYSSTWNQIKY